MACSLLIHTPRSSNHPKGAEQHGSSKDILSLSGKDHHQIIHAKQRINGGKQHNGLVLLESYNTGDIEDIIDILELYDIEARTNEGLKEKLGDLAYTVSELMREVLFFDYTEEGHMGLYLSLKDAGDESRERIDADTVAAAV